MENFGEVRLFLWKKFRKVGVSTYLSKLLLISMLSQRFCNLCTDVFKIIVSNENQFNFSAQIPCNSKENLKANMLEYHLVNPFVTYPWQKILNLNVLTQIVPYSSRVFIRKKAVKYDSILILIHQDVQRIPRIQNIRLLLCKNIHLPSLSY